MRDANINELIGLTLTRVYKRSGDDSIRFEAEDGRVFLMHHVQDCCERVGIESINGDLNDLVMSPIVKAEERTDAAPGVEWSRTYTFYAIATSKGYVDIRWVGESNGYYSEEADFSELERSEVDYYV